MKKILILTLSCLLFVCIGTSALANEWGLRGGIYDIVSDDNRFSGYSTPGEKADDGNRRVNERHVNHAILKNRYHSLLIAAWRDAGVWKAQTTSTTAVYQPGDARGEYPYSPALTHVDNGFKLAYGQREHYTFHESTQGYTLISVRYLADQEYSNSYCPSADGLLFWQSGAANQGLPIGDALWITDGITLDEFNIEQMPRSMAEIRHLNMVSNALSADAPLLEITSTWTGTKNGRKLPVYSAPDKTSYRSAEGKASVSMGGDVQIFGSIQDWTLIQYEVSPRTHRIGWIEGNFAQDAALSFAHVALITTADTFLTDDPFVSQYAQAYLPAGTEVTGLSRCGEYYAYVEYTQGSTLYRGFIPMKDLMTRYDLAMSTGEDLLNADVCWDVMDLLTGKWFCDAGGSLLGDKCVLFSNGSYTNYTPGETVSNPQTGNWRLYRGETDYVLLLRTEDNQESRFDLMINEDSVITLSCEDGEGTYRRNEYSTYGNG